MKKHLNLSTAEVSEDRVCLLANLSPTILPLQVEALVSPMEYPVNGGGALAATPTSSPAPPALKTPTHSVAMPTTPLLQAVYDRNSQQPVYILQSGNGPTLIPVQGIQMSAPPRGGGAGTAPAVHQGISNSAIAIPTSLSLDQLAAGKVAALHTPPPTTPKGLGGSGFSGSGLEGLMQPSPLLLPHSNGGMQLSEAGPIRTIVRQAAKERPSPVAMDGE